MASGRSRGARRGVSVGPGGDTVRLAMADTGIGIAPADQARIVARFGQADRPAQKKVRPTGPGQSLSKKPAGSVGGQTLLDREIGRGSTLILDVPRVYTGSGDRRAGPVSPRRTKRPGTCSARSSPAKAAPSPSPHSRRAGYDGPGRAARGHPPRLGVGGRVRVGSPGPASGRPGPDSHTRAGPHVPRAGRRGPGRPRCGGRPALQGEPGCRIGPRGERPFRVAGVWPRPAGE